MPLDDVSPARYAAEALDGFARALFGAAGLEGAKAEAVAAALVRADLMGRDTHGLSLAPGYLDSLAKGDMTPAGQPDILSDRGACVTWDGRRLPGAWLAATAVALAVERAATYGTVTVSVANGHHIGCLAVYLEAATRRGLVVLLASSGPSGAGIAPFGGRRGVFTANPVAMGIPTSGDPILIDTSTSATTNNLAARLARQGGRFPHPWLLDAEGQPSDDPQALSRGGTILPAGGLDHGQRGYAWAIMVDVLTQGLSGFGRADGPKGASAALFIQVFDPAAFAGPAALTRQTDWLADACRSNPPRPGVDRVRLPGEASLAVERRARAEGVRLHPEILPRLRPYAERLGVALPDPLP